MIDKKIILESLDSGRVDKISKFLTVAKPVPDSFFDSSPYFDAKKGYSTDSLSGLIFDKLPLSPVDRKYLYKILLSSRSAIDNIKLRVDQIHDLNGSDEFEDVITPGVQGIIGVPGAGKTSYIIDWVIKNSSNSKLDIYYRALGDVFTTTSFALLRISFLIENFIQSCEQRKDKYPVLIIDSLKNLWVDPSLKGYPLATQGASHGYFDILS